MELNANDTIHYVYHIEQLCVRRGRSKILELVPNLLIDNKVCSNHIN